MIRINFFIRIRTFGTRNLFEKIKFKEWKLIKHHALVLGVDEVFIMELTKYEIQIGFNKTPFKISGIEFRPSHRIKIENAGFTKKISATIQHYKRVFFENIILRSPSIHEIFILNDPKGSEILNKYYSTNIFRCTVDPVYDYEKPDASSMPYWIKRNNRKVVYTIFGALDWRKNIKNIFEAFTLLDKQIHQHIELLIIGKIPEYFADEFELRVNMFIRDNPDIELVLINEFVSDSHMEYYFCNTDVSLVVYPKFYGSSGLLGRAAKYNSISLVPNVGLMAELCEDYKLGYLCDPYSPTDISLKIFKAFNDILNGERIDGTSFYREHSPELFLNQLNF
ncbi:glycosyltransferase [Dyadobacter sp. NIV53]|uniref:glycosyltransferase n=1 Tax=Dyadobacter sp. NIV53 TaxID=2861765 RepID=UPI001C872396|nr:glycosyltransferase [Dyadobacter sp. NIV53]